MAAANTLSSIQKFTILGLRCNGCATKLNDKFAEIEHLDANVSYSLGVVAVESATRDALSTMFELVEQQCYQIVFDTLSLYVDGWSCAGCASKTTRQLQEHIGVIETTAQAANGQLEISYAASIVKPRQLVQIIESLGYSVTVKTANPLANTQSQEQRFNQESRHQARQLLIAGMLTLPLLMPMILMLFGITFNLNPWLEFTLASVVQFYIGHIYYRGAFNSLKSLSSNMDTLVALGTSAAYFYSCYILFSDWSNAHGQLYFEASAVIITFVSIGKWLEHRAKFSTGQAIRDLMALVPQHARVLSNDNVLEIPVEQVLLGDVVRVLAGESIPVDGIVTSGESDVDESLLTGESNPVVKKIGSPVIAGAINGHGVLTIEVNAVGENTSLTNIIKLVEKAQMTKAPIERLVDKVARVFVPTILLLAMLTFVVWWFSLGDFEVALINAIAVLVVACPCALGLATPAAITVGSGVAAKHGIIIQDPSALEIAGKVERVVFDKTGTLTQGAPTVHTYNKLTQNDNIDNLLYALMSLSEHPLAKAIISSNQINQTQKMELNAPIILAGKGITAQYQARHLAAGNIALMADHNVILPEHLVSRSQHSHVYFAIDDQIVAIIELTDSFRHTSADAIERLKKKDIDTAMLSGDHSDSANFIANQLGIDCVVANQTPQQKLEQLASWQEHDVIAMVGDGINDAPALAQADLGIAMGSGAKVAISSAKITLMRPDPVLVVVAIDIASATWSKVKQNLFLAFVFNTLAIPLAAMGLLSPQLAGLAMALSSVTVLSNALLLKRWRKA